MSAYTNKKPSACINGYGEGGVEIDGVDAAKATQTFAQ